MKLENLPDPAELTIENPCDDGRYVTLVRELAALEKQLEQAEAEEREATAAVLLAGGDGESVRHALSTLKERSNLLARDIRELIENKMPSVKGEIDFEICQKYWPIVANIHKNVIYPAALAVYRGLQSNRVLYGKLMVAGVTINESAMPTHLFPDAAAIGSPDQAGSPLSRYVRWLIDKEILK